MEVEMHGNQERKVVSRRSTDKVCYRYKMLTHRSHDGYLVQDGCSVLLSISSWQGIQVHCLNLAKSMACDLHTTQFELTGLALESNSKKNALTTSGSKRSNLVNTACRNTNDQSSSISKHCDHVKGINSDSCKTQNETKKNRVNVNSDDYGNENEVEFVSVEKTTEKRDQNFKFVPITYVDKQSLCNKLNFSYSGTANESMEDRNESLCIGKPVNIKRVIGDGNCFYRSIAHVVTGSERNHFMLRKFNVAHLLETGDLFKNVIDTVKYQSVRDFVLQEKLMDLGTWAGHTDISSMAHMLERDIYVYDDRTENWQILSAKKPGYYNKVTTERGIYILFTGGNHFDAVESVTTSSTLDEKLSVLHVNSDTSVENKRESHDESSKITKKLTLKKCSVRLKKMTSKQIMVANLQETQIPLQNTCEQTVNVDIDASEVKQVGEIKSINLKYSPVNKSDREKFSGKLGIKVNDKCSSTDMQKDMVENDDITFLSQPLTIYRITGDGNCFYRAISYVTCGKEDSHRDVRKAIVKHILQNKQDYVSLLRSGYTDVVKYIAKERIFNNGTWATELEIMALSNLLDTDVYIYEENCSKWNLFGASKLQFGIVTSQRGIYLQHTNGNHYDVVESVCPRIQTSSSSQNLSRPQNITDLKTPVTRKRKLKTKRKLTKQVDDCQINMLNNEVLENDMEPAVKMSRHTEESEEVQTTMQTTKRKKKRKKGNAKVTRRKNRDQMRARREKKKIEQRQFETDFLSDDQSFLSRKHKNAAAKKVKYQTDVTYRLEKKKENKKKQKDKYSLDPTFRKRLKKLRKARYQNNALFRERLKEMRKARYQNDASFRERLKKLSEAKYQNDALFRERLKKLRKARYQNNALFRERLKKLRKAKYQSNTSFRERLKKLKIANYRNNIMFRERYKKIMRKVASIKYKRNSVYRQQVANRNIKRKKQEKMNMRNCDYVLKKYREIVSHGPEYVCCVCLKLLFKNQVLKCTKAKYSDSKCIKEEYLHTCSNGCDVDCQIVKSPRNSLWICYTCHRKLLAGNMPSEASKNNLELHAIPAELENLNQLETHLIALNIPFMKILNLPKGGQYGVHGPTVCVPSRTDETVKILPRPETDDQFIRVKLKRKLSYKGHYEYQFVKKKNVLAALEYLKKNNKWYFDIAIDNEWSSDLSEENSQAACVKLLDSSETNDDDDDIEDDQDGRLQGTQLDTCLQKVDMRQEVLDQFFDDIICCAPCEKNSPVSLLMDESNEAKCFPVLFPTGQPTFHDTRYTEITLGRYLHNRLMHVDNRFARNTEYIFFAQCIYELQQILSNVSIALRKSSEEIDSPVSMQCSDLKDARKVREILDSNKGYKFLKQIRGTPPYWQSTQKDVLAMVRQLGKPTWFASFTSAEMRWPEVINTLLNQQGDRRKANDLDWTDKCKLLKSNPVTVARMFDKRFHAFLNKVILCEAQPIGKIIDYFYRIEFQQRGSPHTHCLFWVENAPNLGIDKDETVIDFVDKYISCNIPCEDEDEELNEIVKNVQLHSKKHSKSCKKKGTTCRFNFPRQPSEKTFIVKPDDNPEFTEEAHDILSTVKNSSCMEGKYDNARQLFEALGMSQKEFEDAYNAVATKEDIVMRRDPKDIWVNQYNPFLLKAWNANMDLQYITNEYACVVYVVSYMSKAEREMSLLLKNAETEMKEGNEDARKSMKEIGHVYMQNREVSAQESVYRVCSLRLKECSRKVEFIPVGPNPVRMSLPLSVIQSRRDDDDRSPWMPNRIDKYKARPDGFEFENMCLATFCSKYRLLSESDMKGKKQKQNVFKLRDQLGYVQKRSRTNDAVVRYPRFSPTVTPEKHYQSILQLYLPFRTEKQLKPDQFLTYQEFYQTGSVRMFNKNLESVKSIVNENLSQYEKNADTIDQAQEYLEKFGPQEDAWGLLCPETEVERYETAKIHEKVEDADNEFRIPDLEPKSREKESYGIEFRSCSISREDSNVFLRTLNSKQQMVFYKIRQWCLDRVNGKEPTTFQIFVTGGAGTGKSHLVKCICNEGTRILSRMMHNPDDISIMKVAPTGIAAYNINGSTIHNALSIPISATLPYQPLGEEKISHLRNQLGQLQILIIDEISMVDQKLLWYIHGRLRQIKQTRDDAPFGKVSVIAVGDFYQLPPVKGTPLYKETLQSFLWTDNFSLINLEEIMRQKGDAEFAVLLNKLRIKEKQDELSSDDIAVLQTCQTGEQCEDALHIYSSNKQVNDWNKVMLHKKCTNIICIDAEDSELGDEGKNKKCDKPRRCTKASLPAYLWIAENSRVMLIKNVNVTRGLSNGCIGTVTDIVRVNENARPTIVLVKFDNEKVGTQSIEMQQESIGKKYTRKQFPLKLAYACTIHKVQGMTMEKAVVSLKNIFLPGQAYVALSRVTSLCGLTIEDFDPKVVYCNPTVKESLENMSTFVEEKNIDNDVSIATMSIMLHNIQGLKAHFKDIQSNVLFKNSDIICLAETWLNDDIFDVNLDQFKMYNQPRSKSYSDESPLFSALKNQAHGGVAVYSKIKSISRLDLHVSNLEYITFAVTCPSSLISVIYRPPRYDKKTFCEKLNRLLIELQQRSRKCIVIGDFNENLRQGSSDLCVHKLMCSYGYQQHVLDATTEGDTLIDHVYSIGIDALHTEVIPLYYSYHEAVRIQF
ncbi:uncharacterized protein [Diadema antillarum]|uniref:uncharacterized protein isoform X2 n=1 Tax=Diadema antillarum TaxID=105358 RepID=UPI003A83F11A